MSSLKSLTFFLRNEADIPEELKQSCPDLAQVENTEKLSVVLDTVVKNYTEYHECKLKVDTWLEWYKQQKQIHESVK
jgi:hypothetical protein